MLASVDLFVFEVVVCFDRHYPESVRTETLKGAELILIPTVNTRQEPMEMFEQEIHSCLTGRNSYEKADDTEQIIYTDIDIRESQRIRNKKPYTSLRRKEFYL